MKPNVISKPAIIAVEGYLSRNGRVVPDDKGSGEVISEAIMLPDGRLELNIDDRLNKVVIHQAREEYGIVIEHKRGIGPFNGSLDMTKVLFEDSTCWTRSDMLSPVKP